MSGPITRPREMRIEALIRQTKPLGNVGESHLERLAWSLTHAQDASEYDCRRAHMLYQWAITGWTLFGLSLLALAFVCGGGLE